MVRFVDKITCDQRQIFMQINLENRPSTFGERFCLSYLFLNCSYFVQVY